MDSAIHPLNNRGLVDSVTHLLNKRGLVNKIIGSTLKVSLLRVKILLVLKSVLRTVADSRIGLVLCTKIIQHLFRHTLFTFHFHKKDETLSKHACKFLLPLYIISK